MKSKIDKLQDILRGYGKVAVAYSGGVDSTFLLAVARQALGENANAITVKSCLCPQRELIQSQNWCIEQGIAHTVIEVEPWQVEGFSSNPENRCYLCKTNLFKRMLDVAESKQLGTLIDGSNLDDLGVYRPGRQALEELSIPSPLVEAEFTKEQIRACSKEMGLPTWNKPSFACLASRFPYGTELTPQALTKVEKAEDYLISAGFSQVRVRVHGNVARIEVLPDQLGQLLELSRSKGLTRIFHGLGFAYVTMDLEGFRSGSLDEHLKQ